MNDDDARRMIALLEEIRDQQRVQLERQADALAVSREHIVRVREQADRADRLQERAEALQAKSAQVIGRSRGVVRTRPS